MEYKYISRQHNGKIIDLKYNWKYNKIISIS
mgnify:CR=1 FL=1|jgi:hypothetical protein